MFKLKRTNPVGIIGCQIGCARRFVLWSVPYHILTVSFRWADRFCIIYISNIQIKNWNPKFFCNFPEVIFSTYLSTIIDFIFKLVIYRIYNFQIKNPNLSAKKSRNILHLIKYMDIAGLKKLPFLLPERQRNNYLCSQIIQRGHGTTGIE